MRPYLILSLIRILIRIHKILHFANFNNFIFVCYKLLGQWKLFVTVWMIIFVWWGKLWLWVMLWNVNGGLLARNELCVIASWGPWCTWCKVFSNYVSSLRLWNLCIDFDILDCAVTRFSFIQITTFYDSIFLKIYANYIMFF
jgi:hypothetical protein